MKQRRSRQTQSSSVRSQRGFSLLELMVGVTVLAVLLGLAVPTFRDVIESNRVVAQNNDFIAALNSARSEAIKRSNAVTMCASANGAACSGATSWSSGWITFADINSNGNLDGSEVVLFQTGSMVGGLTLDSGTFTAVRYNGMGMLNGVAGTFTLRKSGCTSTTGLRARRISLAVTGRASTTRINCS
jgi:type IV fimbrial biogenesis protein FimT